MPEDTKPEFPKNFLWGASTSGHQVEGGNHDQWTVWELANATELAKTAEKTYGWLPNWQGIKHQAQKPENYISGKGVDHYRRYEEDFDLVTRLNLNSFRFGIEWARIEPEEGVWNETEIEHYRKYIAELRKRNIEPVLNIWHWTSPVWFTDKGGFKNSANLKYFDRFVQRIGAEYAHQLEYIITLNEPNNYASISYQIGRWPPQEHNLLSMLKVYWNLVKAHKRSYKILKNIKPDLQIGVAAQLGNIQAKRPHNILDETSTKIMRYAWNWWYLLRIRHYQ